MKLASNTLLLLCLRCYFQPARPEFSPCLKGWTYSNFSGSCYRRLPINADYNFSEARDLCKTFANSSDLLYLDEENEDFEMYQAFWQFQKENEISWTGAEIRDGILKWVSEVPVNASSKLKVSEIYDNSCVALIRFENVGKLVSSPCQEKTNLAICKMKAAKCKNFDKENVYLLVNRNYYGQVLEVFCKSGYIYQDRSLSMNIICKYRLESDSLEWFGIESLNQFLG